MHQRFLTWCLSLLTITMPLWVLGCASHGAMQPHYSSQPLVSSGMTQAHLPKVVVIVDDETFAELRYFVDDIKDAARKRRADPRYLGQVILPPAVTAKENVERLLALIDKSLQSGHVIADPEPDWRDHSAVQGTGGFAAGVSISVVPGGSIGAVIAEQTGVLPPPTNAFRIGKDIGLLVGGVGQIIVGCGGLGLGAGATTTGGGAPMGVAIGVASVDVMANGYAAVCVASNDLVHIAFHWGDDGTGSTNSTVTTTPEQPRAAPVAPAPKPATTAAPAPAPKPSPTAAPAPAPKPAATPAPAKPTQPSTSPGNRPGGKVKVSPSGTTTRTWVKCTGQWHHAISRKVHTALENHPLLKGKYQYRDDRFVTQAISEKAHRGYQQWHRTLDDEIVAWVRRNRDKGPGDFEAWLHARYAKSDLKNVFPNGF